MVFPGKLKQTNIIPVDFGQFGVMAAEIVTKVNRPVFTGDS